MSSSPSWTLPSAEILTVGLPFCVFKLLTGWIAVAEVAPLGYALLALGAVDLLLNLANLGALVIVHRRISAVCTSELVARDPGVGLALDVFVSFGLVAIVVGFGLLARLPAWALPIWNLAVVLNVLGAGVGRLLAAVTRARAPA